MPAPAWAPTTADVGSILHARTTEVGTGETLGDFGPTTIPTGVQVDGIIERAAAEVVAAVGAIPAPTATIDAQATAKTAVTYLAGMMVELSFFPNQVGDDNDVYARLEARFNNLMATLAAQIADVISASTAEVDDSGAATNMAVGGFPGLVGTTLTEGY